MMILKEHITKGKGDFMKIRGYFIDQNTFILLKPKKILNKDRIYVRSKSTFSKVHEYELTGEFKTYMESGKVVQRFAIEEYTRLLPTKEELVLAYLSELGLKNPAKMKKYHTFAWERFFIQLKSQSLIFDTIPDSFILKFYENEYRKVFNFCKKLDIEKERVYKVIQISKGMTNESIISELSHSPFYFSINLAIGFKDAYKISSIYNSSKNHFMLLEAAIIEALYQNENGGSLYSEKDNFNELSLSSGNSYIKKEVLLIQVRRLLSMDVQKVDFEDALNHLAKSKKIFIINDNIYFLDMALMEFSISSIIKDILHENSDTIENIDKTILFHQKLNKMKLSNEQELAVKTALQNNISVITGGPGTGKSSILKILLSVYDDVYQDKKISLVAPTGRAAKRMTETTGLKATTIHSLLNLTETSYIIRKKHKTLDSDLIIIDEASMLDTTLFYFLLTSMKEGSKLVLVGDPEQLPSVAAGNVLLDLINSYAIPLTKLSIIFRQKSGSTIAYNARKIRVGEFRLEYTDDFQFINAKTDEEILEKLSIVTKDLLSKYNKDDLSILTSFRQHTKTGSNSLNKFLKPLFNKTLSSKYFKTDDFYFNIGDKVMFTKNMKGLANGDIGTILDIKYSEKKTEVTLDFYGDTVILLNDDLKHLTLAYACTIHKIQGLEQKVIVQVVSDKHGKMLTRNLIYTGITRAKEKIILIGNIDTFNKSIRKDQEERKTTLSKLLRAM